MADYPYKPVEVAWKRPPIDRDILRKCTKRSDLKGLLHSLGTLAILGGSGAIAFWFFSTGQWVWMAVALYVHGGLYAFNPQTHEFSHGTVFRTRWMNNLFKRIFGMVHWTANSATYIMSHKYHHFYTLHRQSEGERVHPRAESTEQVLFQAIQIIDITHLVTTIYDQLYLLLRPYLRNSRRNVWQRYVFEKSSRRERRDAYWTQFSQIMFHVLFAVFAIATGNWFLIIIITLPGFYGGKWYHMLVHDTMHVGREPESDDFRACCRTIRVNPITSFLFWHMEWHTEHHAYAAIPCYNLKNFHRLTREHWETPQTISEAWREMNKASAELLVLR